MREIDIEQLATSVQTTTPTTPATATTAATAATAAATTAAGPPEPVVVDVREFEEYVAGHVPGAVNVPMGQLTSRLDEFDRGRPVHVICASGNRSSAMVDVLSAAGIEAVNVRGGTAAWARTGRLLVTGTHPGAVEDAADVEEARR